jgi:putative ABC transport system permease protein
MSGRRGLGLGRIVRLGAQLHAGLSLVLALISLAATAFVVVTPRATAAAADHAVGDALRGEPSLRRDLTLSLRPSVLTTDIPAPTLTPGAGPEVPFDRVDGEFRSEMGPRLRALLGTPTFAAQTDPMQMTAHLPKPLTVDPPEFVVRVQSDLGARVRWTAGGAPAAASATRTLTSPDGSRHTVRVLPVAVRDTTARTLGLAVGDVLDLGPINRRSHVAVTPTSVVVAGLFSPLDARDPFWEAEPRMLGIAKIDTGDGGVTSQAAFVAPLSSYGVLGDDLRRISIGSPSWASSALKHTWRYPLDERRLTSADIPALRSFLVRVASGTGVLRGTPQQPQLITGLGGLLEDYDRSVAQTRVLTSFATAGIAALAAVVLALTLHSLLALRAAEQRLARARGASSRQTRAMLLTGPGAFILIAAVVGASLGVLLVRGGSQAPNPLGWVALLVTFPIGIGLWATREAAVTPPSGARVARQGRGAPPRVILELAVLSSAVLAVLTVRARAASIRAGQVDWIAALAPSLVAFGISVVLLRVLPWVIGRVANLASRRPGAGVFVGLSAASRNPTAATVPVAGLVLGSLVVTLLASLAMSVEQERAVAGFQVVGAGARLEGVRITAEEAAAIARRPGISAVALAHVDPGAALIGARGPIAVSLIAADPAALSRVSASTPLAFDVPRGTSAASLPAVVSDSRVGTGAATLVLRGLRVPVDRVAVAEGLDRVVEGRRTPTALVPLDRLRATNPSLEPNTAFVSGTDDALQSLVQQAHRDPTSLGSLVTGGRSAAEYAANVADRSLPSLVARTYWIGAALAGALGLLAFALHLLRSRGERLRRLRWLHTMGMPRRGARRVARAETVPWAVAACGSGVLAGWAALQLVAPVLDLGPFTGGRADPPISAPWWVALGVWAGFTVLSVLAVRREVRTVRHTDLASELRRGEGL